MGGGSRNRRIWWLEVPQLSPKIKVTASYPHTPRLLRLDFHTHPTEFPASKLRTPLAPQKRMRYQLADLVHLLRASLYVYRPRILLLYDEGGVKSKQKQKKKQQKKQHKPKTKRAQTGGRLVAFQAEESDTSHGDPIALTLYIRLAPGCRPPSPLRRLSLHFSCPLLPRDRFQYGVCDTLHGKYRVCQDLTYLRSPGRACVPDVGPGRDRTRCSVFRLRPPNTPKSYCKFDFSF